MYLVRGRLQPVHDLLVVDGEEDEDDLEYEDLDGDSEEDDQPAIITNNRSDQQTGGRGNEIKENSTISSQRGKH